jgi:PAS domain S-box-containing protein
MPVRRDDFLPHFELLRRLRRRDPVVHYGVAAASVALATATRMALEGSLSSTGLPFITFFPALLVSSFVGGLWPGLFSLLLSALSANYFFLPPFDSFQLSWGDSVALALFMAVGGTIVVLIHLLNEAVDHLAMQEQNARLILETAPAGMIAVDENGTITTVNAAAEKLFGYHHNELLGQSIEVLVPARMRVEHAQLRGAYMVLPTSRAMGAGRDLFGLSRDGAEVPVEIGLNPIVRENKTGALATVVDISERKAAERRQQVLVREVQHRAKNLLLVIQAIAARTFTSDRPVEESRASFEAKLNSLARTQELFFSSGTATLDAIVRGELVGFPDQVTIEVVDISLAPVAAQNFTLIVHELATNALKYGALSTPSGRVVIQCRRNDRDMVLVWSEQGGPVTEPPARKGFGHVILNDLPTGFGAKVTTDYAAKGFRYQLRVTRDAIAEAPEAVAA